jgi:hypothetical protein
MGADLAARIAAGFYSLGWIDDDGRPSEDLKYLVEAFGGETWSSVVADVIRRTYSFVPGDWSDLTPGNLREAFVAYVGYDAESLTSAETFFLCLASDAGLPIFHPKFNRRISRALKEAHRVLKPQADEELEEVLHEPRRGVMSECSNTINDKPTPPKTYDIRPDKETRPRPVTWMEQIFNLTTLIDEADMTEREKSAILVLLQYARRRAQQEK